jgi:Tol biopolymer transport system component
MLLVSVKDKSIKIIGDKAWIGAMSFNWLNDGSGILFVAKSEPENSSQIWYLSYPDGVARQITNDLSDYVSLSLADDDKTMATSKVDTSSSFWTFDPASKEIRQITAENRNNAGFAGIEAGANRKIYYTKRIGKGISIVEAEPDGSNEKQIISDGNANYQPAVSRDQKYIVFHSNRSGSGRIWRTNIDGSNPVRLSDEADSEDFAPQITADDKTVLFMRATKDGGKSTIMSVPMDGGTARPMMPENSPTQVYFRLSPDGKKIAYCTINFDANAVLLDSKLVISGFDGSTIGKPEKEMPATWSDVFDWTPDGKSLIYASAGGNTNVVLNPLDTGKPKPLTEFNSGKIVSLKWAADGKKLYVVRGVVNSDLILIKETAK